MKLLYCPDCGHVFSLSFNLRSCDCGKVVGRYDTNGESAEVNGAGFALAIGNGSLRDAIYRAISMQSKPESNRTDYRDQCRVEYCWIRPHEGDGNPHTRINKDLRRPK